MPRLELRAGVAWILLDRPESGNAVDLSFVAELWDCLREVRRADVGVLVLASTGPAFCVGGDLRAFGAADDLPSLVEDLADGLHRCISELHRLDAVVVAAVAGTAAGAGVPLAAAADIVLASEAATFTLAYTKVGLSPDGGSSLLPASLGLHRSLRLALLNPALTAEQAREAGLVAEVHPDAQLGSAVQAVVDRLAAGSRDAQVAAKRLLREQASPSPDTAMRLESVAIRRAAGTADGHEGISAFLAKRPAAFPSAAARAGRAGAAGVPPRGPLTSVGRTPHMP
jgi:2-(1,2-epoxy-1,2-dihydrophenyl)acetyl-CoA isomerase